MNKPQRGYVKHHYLPTAALIAVGSVEPFTVHGATLALVGHVPGEVWAVRRRRSESLLVDSATRRVYVLQHIRLVTGQTLTAPYLAARGVG